MLSKKVLKDIQSLGLKKCREETGLFVAEGPKTVEELIRLIPEQIETVYATEKWELPFTTYDRFVRISQEELERISQLQTPNQVLATVKQFPLKKPDVNNFVLYLDTIQDPGNFGTIIRIADWFGIQDIICSFGCADRYNPKVIQSTMASIARVNVFYDKTDHWLSEQSAPIFAAALHGKPLSNFKKVDKGILIIGNESKGIREEFLNMASEIVTIERKGGAESLNAAVATGIILSQLLT